MGTYHAKSYKDLIVYQKARALSLRIFKITKSFPKGEMYSLTGQIRRSSRSIGAQIAEAWAKRRYKKHFVSKLTDADGEQQETQHWVETSNDCEYFKTDDYIWLISELAQIGAMLNSMINKADSFCDSDNYTVNEDHSFIFYQANDSE